MSHRCSPLLLAMACAAVFTPLQAARAQDASQQSGFPTWFSGEWSLTVGGAGFFAPSYEGASDLAFRAVPMISLSRAASLTRFSSRNDNVSLGFVDTGTFRAGPTAKLLLPRDDGNS